MNEVHAVARGLGIEVATLEIRRAEDITPAFEALKAQADALYVVGDALVNANRTRIMTLSLSARLPTIFNARSFVQAGGLISYGPNFSHQFRRTAELVDKILRGTKPADIPVEQPDQIRTGHQSHDSKGARPRSAANVTRSRRRGNRMIRRREFIELHGGTAQAGRRGDMEAISCRATVQN